MFSKVTFLRLALALIFLLGQGQSARLARQMPGPGPDAGPMGPGMSGNPMQSMGGMGQPSGMAGGSNPIQSIMGSIPSMVGKGAESFAKMGVGAANMGMSMIPGMGNGK